MTKELLEKYLNNKCTSKEVDEVINWIKQESHYFESQKFAKSNWQKFNEEQSVVSNEKLDVLLDKIHHKINIDNSSTNRKRRNKLLGWVLKTAAILLIPVLSFLFFTIAENNRLTNQISSIAVDSLEVIAPVGSRTIVELSDGTTVHLNYGSRIKYPQNFFGETRNVTLSGEGYFEVAHNPEKPFVVNVGDINVRALGTVFNVMAYPKDGKIETTLLNGKVVLEQLNGNGTPKTFANLVPGQHIEYDKETTALTSSNGNVENYIAWKDGKLIFDNVPLNRIADRLSRIFNVEIQVSKDVEKYRYTVTFIDEPLFQILDLLSEATPIIYKTFPRSKNPNGAFSKQKIIIEKRK